MRILRCLLVLALVAGYTGFAKADPVDFHMNVLDPVPPPVPPAAILTVPFAVTFTPCGVGELPSGVTADGCFAGFNETGYDWNNLQLTFEDNPILGEQPATCDTSGTHDIFSDAVCNLNGSTYLLTFTDGVIPSGINSNNYFIIAEQGVDPTDFGTGLATVLTPEPGSMALLSSGVILFGVLLYGERRRAGRFCFGSSRL